MLYIAARVKAFHAFAMSFSAILFGLLSMIYRGSVVVIVCIKRGMRFLFSGRAGAAGQGPRALD
jgi:hypothetical protein